MNRAFRSIAHPAPLGTGLGRLARLTLFGAASTLAFASTRSG